MGKIKSKYLILEIFAYSGGLSELLDVIPFLSSRFRDLAIQELKLIERLVPRLLEIELLIKDDGFAHTGLLP